MKFTKDYIYDDGGRSKYYRPKKTSNDCVVRSISIALNQDYKDTLIDLCDFTGLLPPTSVRSINQDYKDTLIDLCDFTVLYGEPFNTKNTYEKYLFSKGWLKFKTLIKSNNKKYRITDLPVNDNCLISTRRHLTVLINGVIRDLWDTRNQVAYNYYIRDKK